MGKLNINSNKKGNLLDYISVGTFILFIAITGFISFTILTSFSGSIDQIDTGKNYTEYIEGGRDKTSTSLDYGVLLFLVSAFAFSIIMAKRIPATTPAIIIVLLISFAFFIISMLLSNVFGGLMDNVDIATYMNLYMPISKILLQYFPYISAIYLGTVLIIYFNKD